MRAAKRLASGIALFLSAASAPAGPLAERALSPPLPATLTLPRGEVLSGPDGFRIEIDPLTGRPSRATGGRAAWIAGAGNGLPRPLLAGAARREALFARALAHLREHAGLWRLPAAAVLRDEEGTVCLEEHELDVVRLALVEEGLPVLGGRVVFVLRHGNLVWFGSSHASAPGEARLRPAGARIPEDRELTLSLFQDLGLPAGFEPRPARRPRFLLPGLEGGQATRRVVRAFRFTPPGEPREWEAWIDERGGELLALFPAERDCSSPLPGVRGRVVGGVRPARADDPEASRPLPWADVGPGEFADGDAAFDYLGSRRSSRLEGRYARVNCLGCTNPVQALASTAGSGVIDFGVAVGASADSLGNGYTTTASRTAYAHVHTARDVAVKWLGSSLTFFDRQLEIQVNAQNACNAFWSGFALRFFESSAECRNTGEIRDIVAHEWGHALDDFDGTGISDIALSEGSADWMAMLLDHDTCIGDSIYKDATQPGPSSRCKGVRELDEKAPGLDHSPVVLTWSRNDCQGGAHCLGEIVGQTAWHLVQNLISGRSYSSGANLGKALGDEIAWELLERLALLVRPLAETMNPAGAGLSLYDAIVLADEDPGGNHPHLRQINEAFQHHELNEDPLAPEGFGCSAPADPRITFAEAARGVDGWPQGSLWWTDSVAKQYRVLRRRVGGELAFLPVTPRPVADDDRPEYGLLDGGLEEGETYEYLVVAESSTGCPGGASARVLLPMALPTLSVAAHREADPAPGGNGDGLIAPGEFFELRVDLAEVTGLADATGVVAGLSSLDPLVRIGSAASASFGTIARLQTRGQGAPFTLWIDPLHPCPADLPLVLAIDSDQGCAERALEVRIPAAACPVGDRSEVRFVSARIETDALNPGCADGDGILDAGEQARILVEVENVGAADASEVDVLLSSAEPRLTFLSGSRVSLPGGLAAGARAPAAFEVVLGDLGCGARVDVGVEVQAPENLLPDAAAFSLVTEQDESTRTLAWDFEAGAQGWSGDGLWSLSRTRSYPDDLGQSFYSGAGFNLCSTLLSPPFRIRAASSSLLSLNTWYSFESRFQAKYWDGANVYLRTTAGDVLLAPVSGRGYDATLSKLVLCETNQPAWCSDTAGKTWARSDFDLTPWAGQTVSVAIRYSTDNKTTGEGFYLDEVSVSSVSLTTCDSTTCTPDPGCSVPEMQLEVAASGCDGDPVVLQARFDYFGAGSFAYEWDFGDGKREPTAVPDAPVAHVYSKPGNYIARLTAASGANPLCVATATVLVAVTPAPIADAGPDVGAPSRIGTPGFSGLDYQWNPPDSLSDPTAAQPLASPAATTEYCVRVRDVASGCMRSDCSLVEVPLVCGIDPQGVAGLRLGGIGVDVEASWTALPGAGSYDLFRMGGKEEIPAAAAVNTTAVKVASTPATQARDAGAVAGPPSFPGLLFYQAIARCP